VKRSVLVALSIILLCSLLALPTTLVNAYYAGYETTNYLALEDPVIDGMWSTSTEWDDAEIPTNLPADFHWRLKWTYPSNIVAHYLIEFFTDNTTNAGDYIQICLDCDADGGSTPQTNDFRIDYVGHNASASGVTVYQGNGAGWAEFTGWTWPDSIFVNDTISASPLNSTPHRIVELSMDRDLFDTSTATPAYAPWTRVAVYDENNSTVIAWPPTEQYVPDDWGLETGVYESIPEALTVGVVVLLSSVAVVVSFYCLRKRSKTEGHSSVKTGEITYKG
jgi:hypothetical protein